MKKRLAIDMDEVMADSVARELEMYNAIFKTNITKDELWKAGKHLYHYVPENRQWKVSEHIYGPGFFDELPVIENAIEVITKLYEKYEIFIVTAAMSFPHSFLAKYAWLKEHLPFISNRYYVYCGHKYMIQADYLIDDNSYNFKGFPGQGLLYSAPHNINEVGDNFVRVNDWKEVEAYLLDAV